MTRHKEIVTDDQCADYLRALGDPIRLQIMRALRMGSLTVSDLAELLELDLQKVSHHLRILFHADLVTLNKNGKYRYYAINTRFSAGKHVQSVDLGCCKLSLRS